MQKNSYDDLILRMGLSKKLTESPYINTRIYNDREMNWTLDIFPPIDHDFLHYFMIFDRPNNDSFPVYDATKCARISLISPDYIYCSDSSKEQWILNHEEKIHLCKILEKRICGIQ